MKVKLWVKGGWEAWLEAGEEDVELVFELNLLKNVFSSLALISLLLEACDLLHPYPHISCVVLLKFVHKLFPVHLLVVSNIDCKFFLY